MGKHENRIPKKKKRKKRKKRNQHPMMITRFTRLNRQTYICTECRYVCIFSHINTLHYTFPLCCLFAAAKEAKKRRIIDKQKNFVFFLLHFECVLHTQTRRKKVLKCPVNTTNETKQNNKMKEMKEQKQKKKKMVAYTPEKTTKYSSQNFCYFLLFK